MRSFIAKYPILVFVLLTLGYQFAVVLMVMNLLPNGGHLHDSRTAWMIFRMRVFGPLVFVVGLTLYLEGTNGLKKLFAPYFRWKVPAKWYLLAFSWKFAFTLTAIAIIALLGIRQWPGFITPHTLDGDHINLVNLFHNLPFLIGIAFVEETAWMKFCVTRMQEKHSALASCLLVGLAWGLWYLPMLLIGEGTPDGYPWPVFMISMVALCIFLGWTYNMTRSGVILLIMQIVSNSAFFLIPVLPGWWHLDATYINGFVVVNSLSAITIVLVYGWRELGTGPRARWNELHSYGIEEASSEESTVRASDGSWVLANK